VDQSTYHFSYLNPLSGQIEGFDIDMARAVASAIFGSLGKGALQGDLRRAMDPRCPSGHRGHRGTR
jgi:ABC-type amino acid transport substrate-binding protein